MVDNNDLFSRAAGKVSWEDGVGGDENSFRSHLPWMALRIERGEPLLELERQWLGNVLMDIYFCIEPNIAFFGKPLPGGRARPKMWERWVAFSMYELIRNGSNKQAAATAVKEKAIEEFQADGFLKRVITERQLNCTIDTYELMYDAHETWAREAFGSRINRLR